MDFIIAIFVYLGIVTSGAQVTPDMIEQHPGIVETYQHDPGFMEFYEEEYKDEKQAGTETIGVMDIYDGN